MPHKIVYVYLSINSVSIDITEFIKTIFICLTLYTIKFDFKKKVITY